MKKSFMIQAFESVGIKPWSKYIDYVLRAKLSGALDVDDFIEAWKNNKSATPEELCQISVTPARVIVERISGQLWELADQEAGMLLALNHVAIVRTGIKEAKKAKGIRDRENLLRAGGVIPSPKNNVLHLHRHISVGKTEDNLVSTGGTLPSFEAEFDQVDGDLPPLLSAPKGEE